MILAGLAEGELGLCPLPFPVLHIDILHGPALIGFEAVLHHELIDIDLEGIDISRRAGGRAELGACVAFGSEVILGRIAGNRFGQQAFVEIPTQGREGQLGIGIVP